VESAGETKSHALARELGVIDLLLAQIIMIVGGTWVGTAGKLGPSHVVYWLLASVFFFVPLVCVVLFLNRWAPLEGGLYQWGKLAFGELVGFAVGFNLWLWAVVLLASLGLDFVTAFAYAFPRFAWMHHSTALTLVVSLAVTAYLAISAMLGLRVGKRIHNLGGAIRLAAYAILLMLPIVALALGRPLRPEVATVAPPSTSLDSVNILAKMGFGAFSGFEYVAIFAGESKSPERSFARSVVYAAPIVTIMFVLGTSAVVAFLAPEQIDLITPIPQVLSVATRGLGPAEHAATWVTIVMNIALLAWGSAAFAGITRLPMVAGWDGLLPSWFTRLHPRTRTPTNSILFVAIATAIVSLFGLLGVGHQEAFQLFSSAAMIAYALTYLVMFAIPIVGRGEGMPRPPAWLRIACASGFAMTLLFVVLAIFPIVHVESRTTFALKVSGVVVGANAIGLAAFFLGKRRALRQGESAVATEPRP
jgi:amino acid transporter